MAQIYNLLFKAPTTLTLKTTLQSHHSGAAARGQTDRSAASNLRQSHLPKHHRVFTHRHRGQQG